MLSGRNTILRRPMKEQRGEEETDKKKENKQRERVEKKIKNLVKSYFYLAQTIFFPTG